MTLAASKAVTAGAAPVTVATLVIGTDDFVAQQEQLGGEVDITGTLTGTLAAGGAVEIVLPNGQTRQAVVGSDGVSFSFAVTANADLADFAVANTVSAYIAGAPAAALTQAFTAASQRSFQPVTATPSNPAAATVSTIALSRDGSTVAFVSLGAFTNGRVPASLYVQNLAAGIPRDLQFRNLRATAATELKDAGADILDMSTHTGHKTTTMARRYARPTATQFKRAAAKRQANKTSKESS